MASYSIAEIRAIEPFYATKLKSVGIRSTAKLLERGSTPKRRKQLSEQAGIPMESVLKFVHLADLMRVPGIAADYSELLVAAGIDTVKELKRRNPARLVGRLAEVNGKKPYVEFLPSEKRVARWIEEAAALEPMIRY
jgi:hypothetical protein